jgi:hypothetical protein
LIEEWFSFEIARHRSWLPVVFPLGEFKILLYCVNKFQFRATRSSIYLLA